MTWGSHCPQCGKEDCNWVHGAICEGSVATLRARIAELEAERDRLLAIEQAAHDLLCWTYQHAIMAEPGEYSRHIRDLHPGVINTMNAAECDLYNALSRAALTPKPGGTDGWLHKQVEAAVREVDAWPEGMKRGVKTGGTDGD